MTAMRKRGADQRTARRRYGAGAMLARLRDALLRRFVAALLAKLGSGKLTVRLPDGTMLTGGGNAAAGGGDAMIFIQRWRAVWRLLSGGDLAFGEAYVDGDWTTPDLHSLLMIGARNETALCAMMEGTAAKRMLARLAHRHRRNTRAGSQRNIRAHYDLGNDFYAAWLDGGMSYSSALYEHAGASLEQAQAAKQDVLLRALSPCPDMDILEIGCGWGGLAERLLQQGARVTGLTLSREQAAYARERLAPYGKKACICLQDYRDEHGSYDRIVAVEMFEAVGQAYWPVFFSTLRACLKPGGVVAMQVITIGETRFDAYASRPDFIQTHIFPGGMLPSPSRFRQAAEQAGFVVEELVQFPQSYAATLAEWADRFEAALPALRAGGVNDSFSRKWRFYLAYCEAGFRTELLGVGIYRLKLREEAA